MGCVLLLEDLTVVSEEDCVDWDAADDDSCDDFGKEDGFEKVHDLEVNSTCRPCAWTATIWDSLAVMDQARYNGA